MPTYLVTGATGFLGRHLVSRLLDRAADDGADDVRILALVRAGSQRRLATLARNWAAGDRVQPLVGDLAAPRLGLSGASLEELTGRVDHLVHLAALYDMTSDSDSNQRVNVEGTRRVVQLANRVRVGRLHHVSSVAVAGGHRGRFTEADFDVGQRLPSPYHATKFEAERIVRAEAKVPWRVFRPAIVVGHSATGEMDKIDGPYYFFPLFQTFAALPAQLPLILPDVGATNLVPVDYVAAAMAHLMHADGLDGRAFHLVSPRPQPLPEVLGAFSRAAGGPRVLGGLPVRPAAGAVRLAGRLTADRIAADRIGAGRIGAGRLIRAAAGLPAAQFAGELALDTLAIPRQVLPHLTFRTVFDAAATEAALAGTGIAVPALRNYAGVLWRYWEEHLDPARARRPRPGGPLAGRRVVITGASSGIGRATAVRVAQAGGVPLLVARRTEALEEVRAAIERAGGQACVYSCDLTQPASVDTLVKQLLTEHESVDMLVNNAGRSIRRSVRLSYERAHDYERTMALNYFAAVRLILGLLPHMTERRFGHIVNVSSIGVQANPPRFSAYVASKAALDALGRVAATETFGAGVTFTTIHMPLVRTPMIRPTRIYDAFPTISPEQAAGMVLDGLIRRPKHIGTRLGTFAEVSYALAPRLVDGVLHLAYQAFPDSAAAAGGDVPAPAGNGDALSRVARTMVRLLPGVHW